MRPAAAPGGCLRGLGGSRLKETNSNETNSLYYSLSIKSLLQLTNYYGTVLNNFFSNKTDPPHLMTITSDSYLFIYFSTSTINELQNVIVEYSDSNKFQYCAIGGDGSLNSLINALMNKGVKKPEVACLPAGSGSDFIRTFALPQNIEETIKHLITDSYYEIDVGKVVAEHKEKYFINVLNIGFLALSLIHI